MTHAEACIRDYHDWLIANSSIEDDELGIYRPYFWNFSILGRHTWTFS